MLFSEHLGTIERNQSMKTTALVLNEFLIDKIVVIIALDIDISQI